MTSNSSEDDRRDDQIERLLDEAAVRAVSGSSTAAGEAGQEQFVRELALQKQIEESLARRFRGQSPATGQIEAWLRAGEPIDAALLSQDLGVRRRLLRLTAAALAASVAVITWWSWRTPRPAPPEFTPQPLASIYRSAVAAGFEPYYECNDADRFAATFAARQGVALKLAPLGSASRMLGLSYAGGLSRQTTTMLCRVEGRPVALFVDRRQVDGPTATAEAGPDLHIFRREDDRLVYYEVTPLDEPRVLHAVTPLAAGETPPPFPSAGEAPTDSSR